MTGSSACVVCGDFHAAAQQNRHFDHDFWHLHNTGCRRKTRCVGASWPAFRMSMMTTAAGAGPMFYPKPDVYPLTLQDLYIDGCDSDYNCVSLFVQGLGDSFITLNVTEYGSSGYKSFSCPLRSGDLVVRDDGAEASLNATIDAADCEVSTPDYQGTINVVANVHRPAGSNIASSQNKAQFPDGTSSSFTCQEKSGSDFLEAAAAINGRSLVVNVSAASKRDCKTITKFH
jgi:hypothetical protein